MTKPQTHQTHLLFAALVALVMLLAISPTANADYLYDFHFDEITYNNITYLADGFSFTSPALIGPGTSILPGSPFIDSLTLASPLELNGFSFNTFQWGAAAWNVPFSVATIYELAFNNSFLPDLTLPPGAVCGISASISFPAGTYGPGSYTSDSFGRTIRFGSGIIFAYTTGSLTIREVPAVPIPGAAWLLGSGLLGLLGLKRKFLG